MKILNTILSLLVFCGAVGTAPKEADAKGCCGCGAGGDKTETVETVDEEAETE